jgi:hypothetical protein
MHPLWSPEPPHTFRTRDLATLLIMLGAIMAVAAVIVVTLTVD